jgi:voltage-gated potassium channel
VRVPEIDSADRHHTVVTEPIPAVSGPLVQRGAPRDDKAAAALASYDERARLPLVLSALLPLVIAPEPGNPVSVAIGIVSWLVFVVDFIVHERLLRRYLSTHLGKFDLAIVLLTAPWFLLPGAVSGGGVIVVLRLARLARLVAASKRARQLFARLGRVAVVASSVMVVGAVVAYYAEHAVNPEFATFGDSLWWAIVTLTTVGYGDIVPETTTGRIAAVMIMLTGVAVLGLLAGTLASFFRLQPTESTTPQAAPPGTGATTTAPDTPDTEPPAAPGLDQVLSELTQLRAQVDELSEMKTQLAALTTHLGRGSSQDAPVAGTTPVRNDDR